jgi:hypothetical protein
VAAAIEGEALLLAPLYGALAERRRELGGGDLALTIQIIAPTYACAGKGLLRIVRLTQREASVEVCAAYEGYDRL